MTLHTCTRSILTENFLGEPELPGCLLDNLTRVLCEVFRPGCPSWSTSRNALGVIIVQQLYTTRLLKAKERHCFLHRLSDTTVRKPKQPPLKCNPRL